MQATHITADRREAWNAFAARELSFALLQSWEWGEFKEKLGWKVIRIGVEHQGQILVGAQVLIKSIPLQLASVAYVPRGPLLDWENQEATTLLLQAIHQTARQHKAVFLRIEPPLENSPITHSWLQDHEFLPSTHTNQPRCTLILDLTSDLDEIFNRLSKNTRKKLRATERKGVQVRAGDKNDFDTFYHIMQSTRKRTGFPIRPYEYYARELQTFSKVGRVRLSLARYKGEDIAVDTTFIFGNKAASFHGGFIEKHRQLKINHLLLWKAICWAKEQRCDSFDLWGIPDEVCELTSTGQPIPTDRRDGLWGVYYFKNAFAGQALYYVGAYDYVYRPLLYRIIMLANTYLRSLDWVDRLISRYA